LGRQAGVSGGWVHAKAGVKKNRWETTKDGIDGRHCVLREKPENRRTLQSRIGGGGEAGRQRNEQLKEFW